MVMSGYLIATYVLLTNSEVKKFAFLTKPKVKMAGYWPSSSLSVFMDRDDVENHKNGKKQRGLYPAILPSMRGQKWFIISQRDFPLLRIKKELFISRAGKDTCVCSTINPRGVFMVSFYYFILHLNSVIDSASFHSSYKLSYCQTPQLLIREYQFSGAAAQITKIVFVLCVRALFYCQQLSWENKFWYLNSYHYSVYAMPCLIRKQFNNSFR